MHTLILLSGPAATGKTKMVRLMRNAKEIESDFKLMHILKQEIEKESNFFETIVVTSQVTDKVYFRNEAKHLKEFADKHKINFLSYRL